MIRLIAAGNEEIGSGGVEAFQWSTSEQEYPLEKFIDGSQLYAKQISCGALPNTGYKYVNTGISGLNGDKVHRIECVTTDADVGGSTNLVFMQLVTAVSPQVSLTYGNQVRLYTNASWPTRFQAFTRITYKK